MMRVALLVVLLAFSGFAAGAVRERRQAANEVGDINPHLRELCRDKSPKDYFRIDTTDCRDVVRCTESGLNGIRCPIFLAFDIDKQTCEWRQKVTNCDRKEKLAKSYPLINTIEPLCENGERDLACGDGTCLPKKVFCDSKFDCDDESDENKEFCKHHDPNSAKICDYDECQLPDCFCYKPGQWNRLPGNLPKKQIPQMIMITFDDAVNQNNMDLYEYIFNGERINPNGCTIKSTFFVSHKFTNYSAVQELNRLGHEIAVHSISHNSSAYWVEATKETWEAEFVGAKDILNQFANISLDGNAIYGARAPYLKVGGNRQFLALEDSYFLYDSSMVVPYSQGPLWPYLLYYKMPHTCYGEDQACPTRPFATWEIPLNTYRRSEDNYDNTLPNCPMVDSCFTNPPSGAEFYDFLENNFLRHNGKGGNNAPFGLYFHSAFLKNNPDILDAFIRWIDEILATRQDVFFVTMTQVLLWMQNPSSLDAMANFPPWKEFCIPVGEPACPSGGNNCELTTDELPGATFRMATCEPCPNKFPWLSDPTGSSFF